jgi:hypothetical protein
MAARDDHAEPDDEVTRKVLRELSGPLTMRAGRLWPQAETVLCGCRAWIAASQA